MEFKTRQLHLPHLVTEAVYAGAGAPGSVFTSGGLQGGYDMFLQSGLGDAVATVGLAVGWKRRLAEGNRGPFCFQSFESNAIDLLHVIDAFDIDRPNLMGSSIGCSISLTFAYWMPERVNKLVLVHPTCIDALECTERLPMLVERCNALVRKYGVAGAVQAEGFPYQLSPDRDDLAGGHLGDTDPEEFITLLQETYRRMGTARLPILGMPASMIQTIEHRAIVIAGSDEVHPPQAARVLADLLPNGRPASSQKPGEDLEPHVLEEIVEFLKQ
jgi:pimeloyl-ACP methyl ester carboxylesterase